MIGEYGIYPLDGSADSSWMTSALNEARTRSVVAMSYFNSSQGPRESWEFLTPQQAAELGVVEDRKPAFAANLRNSPYVSWISDLE